MLHWPRKNTLNFGVDLTHATDPKISFCFFDIARYVGYDVGGSLHSTAHIQFKASR